MTTRSPTPPSHFLSVFLPAVLYPVLYPGPFHRMEMERPREPLSRPAAASSSCVCATLPYTAHARTRARARARVKHTGDLTHFTRANSASAATRFVACLSTRTARSYGRASLLAYYYSEYNARRLAERNEPPSRGMREPLIEIL